MLRLSVALFLVSAPFALAQAPAASHTNSSASPVVLRSIPTGAGCPIGFRADRQSTVQILSAGDIQKNGPELGLHLTLDRQTAPAIESIEVTVYGVSPRGRVLPTDLRATDLQATATNTRDTISKSFELQRSSSNQTLSNADIWMTQVGALRWVDLNAIRYADGTNWRPTASEKCRAVPSNFVLVGQR